MQKKFADYLEDCMNIYFAGAIRTSDDTNGVYATNYNSSTKEGIL